MSQSTGVYAVYESNSCHSTVTRLFSLSDIKLMLPYISLAGYLWRGSPARSHATLGVTCGRDHAVNVDFTWIAENDPLNLIWMPLQGVCWFLCCRQGFSLLGRDYGEKEEEESFELRNKEDLSLNGRVKTLHLHLHSCSYAWIFYICNAWQTSVMQIPLKSYSALKLAACAFKMTYILK